MFSETLVEKKLGTVVQIDGRLALWLRRVGDRLKAAKKCKENAVKKMQRENELQENL